MLKRYNVTTGDLLVELDSSIEAAQLSAARSAENLSRLNLERIRGLRRTSVVAQSELDAAEAEYKNTVARVQELDSALEKRTIRAPFSGRLGIRQIQDGQYLKPGDSIVSLQAMDPVYVNFSLPQQRLADISDGMTVRVSTDSVPGMVFEGRLTAIDSEIDVATRNINLQATFANKEGLLRPGMFVAVSVVSPKEREKVVIPATAILFAAYGSSVFVVKEVEGKSGKELVAEQKFIRTGDRKGDFVAVEQGLSPGDRVVSTGGFKLRNGSKITIADSAPLPFSEKPNPPEK
jgi:membrane fusion protein (multidrug efflux system)